eukprot:GHVR01032614.1.p1 GENE.GHVR01032614.1~~GHVR01032614.1.p1  ORF type:complete len:277 (+),score=64.94 GHVR01032614.1:25-855(+)
MSMNIDKLLTYMARVGVVCGTASTVPYFCLFNVDGGQRGVMFNRFGGVSNNVVGEGTHFVIPWFQKLYIYDVRAKAKTISTTTGTMDLQMVNLSLRLLYRPSIENLPNIHKTLGPDYDDRVLPSLGNEVMKAVVAQYNAESLLTKRESVSIDIREAITKRCCQFQVELDDVAITHLNYGKEFARAIEEKQVAEQEAERSKFVVEKSEFEKQAAVVKAEGEATAAKMISDAVKAYGLGVVEIRRIEAAKEITELLSKSKNITYVPYGGMNLLMNMNQ